MQTSSAVRFDHLIHIERGHFFDADLPIHTASAPGRLDLMGGIADYSGALVLELPIAESTRVAIQLVQQPTLTIRSIGETRVGISAECHIPLSTLSALTYAEARAFFQATPQQQWAAYIAGIFLVLMRENGVTFRQGARLLIHSDVPEGKGVSSSAAVETAVFRAVQAAYDLDIAPDVIAPLCQKAENLVAGAACGIMDQMTVAHGRPGQLLALRCQPAQIIDYLPLPADYTIWGIDSGIRHAVSGSDYSSVRIGAFMGLKIIQSITGRKWGGYLANLSPAYFEQTLRQKLPISLKGQDFLDQFGALPDAITTVDFQQSYAVQQPTAHPIYEQFRVQTFAQLFAEAPLDRDRRAIKNRLLGELMYQSHASYSACGLGSSGTDRLVDLVREQGEGAGLYGAKISGGGSGGTVVVLGSAESQPAINTITTTYQAETGHSPHLFKINSE